MTEQRRNIRIPVKMNLEVSDIFKQDNVKVSNINAPIKVTDICRDGIGFVTTRCFRSGFILTPVWSLKTAIMPLTV